MALNIISNYAANVAHRNLSTTDRMATDSLTKLSSGTRVVSLSCSMSRLSYKPHLTPAITRNIYIIISAHWVPQDNAILVTITK